MRRQNHIPSVSRHPGITWRTDSYVRGCIVVYRRSIWRIAAVWAAVLTVFALVAWGVCG